MMSGESRSEYMGEAGRRVDQRVVMWARVRGSDWIVGEGIVEEDAWLWGSKRSEEISSCWDFLSVAVDFWRCSAENFVKLDAGAVVQALRLRSIVGVLGHL